MIPSEKYYVISPRVFRAYALKKEEINIKHADAVFYVDGRSARDADLR